MAQSKLNITTDFWMNITKVHFQKAMASLTTPTAVREGQRGSSFLRGGIAPKFRPFSFNGTPSIYQEQKLHLFYIL